MEGKVQTVLGLLNPDKLGVVLPHEHFEVDIEKVFRRDPLIKPILKDSDFSLRNIGWIRQYPYSHLPNMRVSGNDIRMCLIEELKQFRSYGGKTIVENTSFGFRVSGRSELLKKLSSETQVNIVAGTGFYVNGSQGQDSLNLSVESMMKIMREEILDGSELDSSVKCGIVGEVGCSWPLTDFERRSLMASAEVENELGCPVMIHPGRHKEAPEEIIRIYSEAGGNCRHVAMAHLDRTLHTEEDILEFARSGTYLEYDLFGIETSYYQQNEEIDMPSDAQRIQRIKTLLDNSYEDKILISHDIHTKHRLECFGGHGFSHLLSTVFPMMMKRGITKDLVNKITIQNPADWLTFKK